MKKLFVSTLLMAGLASLLPGQSYNITTIAGSSTGAIGDNGPAAAASLVAPAYAVADAAGNIYVADTSGFVTLPATNPTTPTAPTNYGGRIRKIAAGTGVITTLFNSSTNFEPRGMALDAAGAFLYVADNNRHIIRKIDTTTGANTTVVGSSGNGGFSGDGRVAGVNSRLRNPRGVWVDASGNIFIADTGNSRIRRIDAGTGIISTVAGRGPTNSTTVANPSGNAGLTVNNVAGDGGKATLALLGNPEAVTGDNKGNIYIADTAFNRIRKVNLATGIITTVAGLGTSGSADGLDATLAQFNAPRAISVGPDGNLYITDTGNNRIRRVNLTTNVVTTVVGGGSSTNDNVQGQLLSLSGPLSATFDATGNLIVADTNNARIRNVDATTGLVGSVAGRISGGGDGGPAGNASLSNPRGVAVGSDGAIYISDTGNNKVRKIDPATGIISRVLGNASNASGNGLSAANGGANGPGPALLAGINQPGCVVAGPGSSIIVADRLNSKIRAVDATGTMTTLVNSSGTGYNGDGNSALGINILSAGAGTNSGGPNCVAADNLGTLYIADTGNNVIRKVSNGIISTVVGFVNSTVNNAGTVTNSGVSGYAGDGGLATEALLAAPQGVGLDATGNLLCIADTGNHIVRQVDLGKNTIQTVAGLPGNASSDTITATSLGWQSSLNGPSGCVYDAAGAMYIADTLNNRIVKLTAAGIISIIAGGGTDFVVEGKSALTARLYAPTAVAVDATGNVYFTDRYGLVKKLTPAAATTP